MIPEKELVLCLKEKYVKDFIDFLEFRQKLFVNEYCNSDKSEYSHLIEKILVAGNEFIKLDVENIECFVHLNDKILFKLIETFKSKKIHQEIVEKFENKDFYHCAYSLNLKKKDKKIKSDLTNILS